jgi:hypothetical protein
MTISETPIDAAQPSAVTTGPLDRPGPQSGVVVPEPHELGIALGCRLDRDLFEDPTRCGVEDRHGLGMDVSVDVNDDTDHPHADRSDSCFLSVAERDVVPVLDGGWAGL